MPSFAELEAAGAVIGEIRVLPEDIFDLDDPRENNWLYRLANKLHINTRPETIRRTLLFKSGDKLSVRLIEETERLLRGSPYLYEVTITPIAVRDGVVDLEVKTRDTWSLEVGASASRSGGENAGGLSLKEGNLFGTGISVGVSYSSDVDRSGTEFEIADRNLFGTRGAASYSYAKNDDGGSESFALARPFYELDARWAAGISASRNDGLDTLYNAGNSVAEYRHRREVGEVFGGWSAGLVGRWTKRYSVGITHDRNAYELEPGTAAPERLPTDLTLTGPFVRFEALEDAFRKDTNLNLIGRVEDLTFGLQALLQIGRALESLGSTQDAWLYSASLAHGFDITKDSFVLTSISAGGRHGNEGGENQSLGGSARYYLRHGRQLVYYASASADAVDNPDVADPLYIGGDNGLRGYPLRYQSGERRALLTLEARAYSDWYPFRLFRVGGAVFYDTGRAWHGENQNSVNAGWLRDVGFGLRLLNARSSKGNVLHADFAFPLDADPSIKKVQFLVKTKISF